MAKKEPQKRTPQKQKRAPATPAASAAEMIEDIAARPQPATAEAIEIAAEHRDAALAALADADIQTAVRRAQRAVDANPRDVESLELYADLASEDEQQLLAALRVVMRVAREELGELAFIEDRGHFWGLIDTRPYMRVKMRIVGLLQVLDEAQQAIAECDEMLSLNPEDNQGAREPLVGFLLAEGHLDRADDLMTRYDEPSAVMLWGRLLWHLLTGDTGETADTTLQSAQLSNVFVAPLLLAAFEMPAALPSFFSPGGPNEGVVAADCLLDAWRQDDDRPLKWLADRVRL